MLQLGLRPWMNFAAMTLASCHWQSWSFSEKCGFIQLALQSWLGAKVWHPRGRSSIHRRLDPHVPVHSSGWIGIRARAFGRLCGDTQSMMLDILPWQKMDSWIESHLHSCELQNVPKKRNTCSLLRSTSSQWATWVAIGEVWLGFDRKECWYMIYVCFISSAYLQ